jgi:LacI family transcriptional regulator
MESNRSASLRTIADIVGVHPSTVSRALKDPKSARIAPQTVDRIRQVAEEHGYAPNAWAKSLRTRRSMMVGLTMPRLTDTGLAQMFDAAQRRALELGYQTVLVASEHAADPEAAMQRLLDGRTDGLIISTAHLQSPDLDRLERSGVPFVLLNRSSGAHPGVFGDDIQGGRLAAEHLVQLGHRRIGSLAGPADVSTGHLRLEGFRRVLAEAGVPVNERWLATTSLDVKPAIAAAHAVLSRPDRPTALVTVNDTVAIAAMSVAGDLGLRVPQDLSVVGYNDSELAGLMSPPLTSVRVPIQAMGTAAVDLLVRRIAGEEISSTVFTPVLIRRQSTAPPPADAAADL